MKDTSSRFNGIFDALLQPNKSSKSTAKDGPKSLHERPVRKEFVYYMQVIDYDTKSLAGHLSDISTGGFKLDCQNPVPVNKEFHFTIKLTNEISNKTSILFTARCRWCKVDPFDPYIYNAGFQLVQISPQDLDIFAQMMENYGRTQGNQIHDFRRSNKW